jgi:hypothetical protein
MLTDLKDRKWPERARGLGMHLLHQGYVTEGQMVALSLGFPGMCMPIPADEAYVTALGIDRRKVVYGGTGGRSAHLIAAMTFGLTGVVIDMGVLQEDARVTSVMPAVDGRVFATTAPGAPLPVFEPPGWPPAGEGALYAHDAERLPADLIHEWSISKTPAEKLCVPLQDEGIACAVLTRDMMGAELILGIGERTGTLFTYHVETKETQLHGPVDEHGLFSKALIRGRDDTVYGTGALGALWRFGPFTHGLDKLDLRIPSVASRAVRNQAESFALDRRSGLIYGGGTADGVLFVFDPKAGTVRSLGKPNCYRGVRGLAVTNDGRLFGMAGRRGDIAHLFCYEPQTHEVKDLGMVASVLESRRFGYEFSSSAVSPDGHIYFGELDRGGHVWLYCPAIKSPAEARCDD